MLEKGGGSGEGQGWEKNENKEKRLENVSGTGLFRISTWRLEGPRTLLDRSQEVKVREKKKKRWVGVKLETYARKVSAEHCTKLSTRFRQKKGTDRAVFSREK